MKTKFLTLAITILLSSTTVSASTIKTKSALVDAVESYESLADSGDACRKTQNRQSYACKRFIKRFNVGKKSEDIKLFTAKASRYQSIDKPITQRGLSAIRRISDAVVFVTYNGNY
ncbi:hypothetical protein [Aestuariibacter sp. A3R04]|uniref:hypothetical protein n=1 Tax=Aestuariibacter sp. A3R04 TaxID=2841571 RepID=UPI001C091B4C|nr:hypothetical protein [Aestuariibacter sp. A3R04]MBU3023965.1 hypothetical protein [Aestuariibacter sp. A3R04]